MLTFLAVVVLIGNDFLVGTEIVFLVRMVHPIVATLVYHLDTLNIPKTVVVAVNNELSDIE